VTLWTIGYEKLWPNALIAELSAAGVQRVLDVRLRPQSRRPGMSKTRLGLKLAEHGIAYEHRREFGTPMEMRGLFRAGRGCVAVPRGRSRRVSSARAGGDAGGASAGVGGGGSLGVRGGEANINGGWVGVRLKRHVGTERRLRRPQRDSVDTRR
jgi:hypothetical protein